MANLFLHELKCVEDIEDGDSPYFVVFVGRPGKTPTSDVTVIRDASWDNQIDTGESRVTNIFVAGELDTSSLVLIAAMEEDNNPDIAGGDLANVRNWMTAVFKAFASVIGISFNKLGSEMMKEFRKALNANIVNDKLVDLQRLIINTTSGQLTPIGFWGEGGEYRLQFSMVTPMPATPVPPQCQKVADELKALKAQKSALQKTDKKDPEIIELEAQIIQTKRKLNTCISNNT